MMSTCLLQREDNIVLSDANCIVSLLYVNRCTHHGHNGYICLLQRGEDLVLREANYCVIDEVDSILIDEARTPLIISGSAEKPSEK